MQQKDLSMPCKDLELPEGLKKMVGEATFKGCIGWFCYKQRRSLLYSAELELAIYKLVYSFLCLHTVIDVATFAIYMFSFVLSR